MYEPVRLLQIEDDDCDAELVRLALDQSGFSLDWHRVESEPQLRDALKRPWDLVISDFTMPGFSGLKAFEIVVEQVPDVPFVFVSGTLGEERAVEAMRAGAKDYFLKGKLARLPMAVRRELAAATTRRQRRLAEHRPQFALTGARQLDVTALRNARVAIDRATRQRLVTQLRRARKMELPGRLASGVAHDFNNLLMVILSFGALARRALADDDPVGLDVDELLAAAARAQSLADRLLAFCRETPVVTRVLNVNEVVGDTQRLLRRLLGEDIQIALALAPELEKVKMDPEALRQLLINLSFNAREAMPDGGTLTIETRNVRVDRTDDTDWHPDVRPGLYVGVFVTTSGGEMDAATRARLFEPFIPNKGAGPRTGLGLSTCYGIVKKANGAISVASHGSEGTTFNFLLPKSPPRRHPA